MISINSQCVEEPSEKGKEKLKLHRQTLLYKIACVCYLLAIIVLLTFFVVRAFKSKFRLDTGCTSNTWIDMIITILTLVVILLGSALLIASLKYVSKSESFNEAPSQATAEERIDDFVRRNSQQAVPPVVTINRSPSISSSSWLSSVRTEAYETQRRMSMAPSQILKIDAPK